MCRWWELDLLLLSCEVAQLCDMMLTQAENMWCSPSYKPFLSVVLSHYQPLFLSTSELTLGRLSRAESCCIEVWEKQWFVSARLVLKGTKKPRNGIHDHENSPRSLLFFFAFTTFSFFPSLLHVTENKITYRSLGLFFTKQADGVRKITKKDR